MGPDTATLDAIEEELEQEEAWDQYCEWWEEWGDLTG
jgi:hypothetical protein